MQKFVERAGAFRRVGVAALVAAALVMFTAGSAAWAGEATITWYGQAAFKIVTPSGGVILIDPWLTVPTNPDKKSVEKLGRVDYILITHGHGDHVGNSVEIAKKTGAELIAPYGLQFNLKAVAGYPEKQATLVTGGNVGGTFDLKKAGAHVLVVNAVHGSELTPPVYKPVPGGGGVLTSGNPVGYVIKIDNGPTIYHTGDTDVFTDMKLIPIFNKVDLMLACIGGHFTMDPERAALAVEWVEAAKVVPIHFGTFGLLAGTPARFKAALDTRGLGSRMVEMKPGDTRKF